MSLPKEATQTSGNDQTDIQKKIDEIDQTATKEDMENWADWLHEVFVEDPELLTLREQVLPFTGGHSFAQAINSDTSTTLQCIDNHTTLELIYQHLMSIGMNLTATILKRDTNCQYQNIEQDYDATTLRLIASLGVLTKEDPWDIPTEPNHHYHPSDSIEGFFGSSYKEEPSEILSEFKNPEEGVEWDPSSERKSLSDIRYASLRRLIVFLLQYDFNQANSQVQSNRKGESSGPDYLNIFFFLLLSIARSEHLFNHLETVFYLDQSIKPHIRASPHEKNVLNELKRDVVQKYRSRILQIIDKFISFLGLYIGNRTLKLIAFFCQNVIEKQNASQQKDGKLITLAQNILEKIPKLQYGMLANEKSEELLEPDIKDQLILFSPFLTIMEPEPMEVARQITLLAHQYYKAIYPSEIFLALKKREISAQTPSIQEFINFGDNIRNLFKKCLSNATKNDFDRIMEILQKLLEMGNYDSMARVLQAIIDSNDSSKSYLNQPAIASFFNKYKKECGLENDIESKYQQQLNNRYRNKERAIPNLSVELFSLSKDQMSSNSMNDKGLIYIPKRLAIAKKINVLYQFQCRTYNFYEIPQIMKVLKRKPADTKS